MSQNLAASTKKSVTVTAEEGTDGRYKINGAVTGQKASSGMFTVSGGATITFTDVIVDGSSMPQSGSWCGAVYVSNGTVNLGSGAVVQNFVWSGSAGGMGVLFATSSAGVIKIQDGSKITGCSVYNGSDANPAAVVVAGSQGKVEMTGGLITGNYDCTVVGIGSYKTPQFWMTGGEIKDNKIDKGFAAVYMRGAALQCDIQFGGSAYVYGNTKYGEQRNIYLKNVPIEKDRIEETDYYVSLQSALTTDAMLGIYAVNIGVGTYVAKGISGTHVASASDAERIFSDKPSGCGVVFDADDNNVIKLSTNARTGDYIYVSNTQGSDISATIGSKNNPYTSLAEAYEKAKPNDTIVLLTDIELTNTLDLDGNANLGDSSTITITSDGEAKKITRSGTQTVLSVSKGIVDLNNVILGGDDTAAANSPAVTVSGGTLTLGTGSSVQGFKTNLASTSTVLVSGGALVIDGGSITGNAATDAGAIKQTSGTVTLNSGSITENVSESTAGGIYFVQGKLFLNGGEVKDNKSNGSAGDGCAGGIYISNGESTTSTVAIGGGDTSLEINGNTDANGDSNLKVVTGGVVQRISDTTLAEGSTIGLSLTTWPSSGSQWILSQVSESEAEYFSSDKPSLAGTVRDSDGLYLSFDDRTAMAVYVSENGSDTTGDGTKEHPFATVDHAYDIVQDNGTIYLLSDISQDASVAVDENKTVTIASEGSNNYSLNRTGVTGKTMFTVSIGTLKLTNVTLDGGNYQTSASNAVLMSGGTVEIAEGATIKQFCTTDATGSVGGAVTVNGGTLNMTGGTIQDNSGQNGGGVLLNGGTMRLRGRDLRGERNGRDLRRQGHRELFSRGRGSVPLQL